MLIFAALLLVSPLSAVIQTAAFTKLWQWFAAEQYGPGPTTSTWYGIAVITSMILNLALFNVPREKRDGAGAATILSLAIGSWIGIAITVGIAWVVGYLTGWMS